MPYPEPLRVGWLRVVAACVAAVAVVFLTVLLWETRGAANGPSPVLLAIQIGVHVLAIVAGWRGWVVAMVVLFGIAFVPVGLYFLGAPSMYAIVGVADLGYLGAAVGLMVQRAGRRPRAGPASP